MLSKNQTKIISNLNKKKYRDKHGLFVVEGLKSVNEFLKSDFELAQLYAVDNLDAELNEKTAIISETELKSISFQKNPSGILGVFKIKKEQQISPQKGLTVALDGINDPGNLGTIIRLCDWFGVKNLFCSMDTVDCYNPKVIQASMGSLTRVNVFYLDLEQFLKTQYKIVYGTFMNGDTIYKTELSEDAILILGNEANGIRKTIEKHIDKRIAIPQFGNTQSTESLNVANAAAIFLSEFARRTIET
jgi:RNA methyltransferase, TrmH family